VVIGGKKSRKRAGKSSVPQGTVIGPLLFTVFIDNLDKVSDLVTLLVKFADDA
jgi:ribonucleases P/MRP protein subunit RPP40